MPRPVKCLDVKERARTKDDLPKIDAKARALNLIPAKAGLNSYPEMTRNIWNRLLLAVGEEMVNAYPSVDRELKAIVLRALDGFVAVPPRPK